jgi:hypothetical protein
MHIFFFFLMIHKPIIIEPLFGAIASILGLG